MPQLRKLLMLIVIATSEALVCWVCENEPSNLSCLSKGKSELCQPNQKSCQNEIRRGSFGILITKSCKQGKACLNNKQNLKHRREDGTFCNSKALDSVCRCCCKTNDCNKKTVGCEEPKFRSILTNKFKTRKTTPSPSVTTTTTTKLSTPIKVVSTTLITPTTVQRNPPNKLPPPTCGPPEIPLYGGISCYPSKMKNGRYKMETECEFGCSEGYILDGSSTTMCLRVGNSDFAKFNAKPPSCRLCEKMTPIKNGEVSCTNELNSECFFECNRGYSLHPPDVKSATCLDNGAWSLQKPCCVRECPPNAYADVIILLDGSSSIGEENWGLMKDFVINMIRKFDIGENTAHFSILPYRVKVEQKWEILLSDFPTDKDGLIAAVKEIPYLGGSRSDTGLALQYALNNLLKTSNGDRSAPNVFLVITNSEAYDDETVYMSSLSLRIEGIYTFVVGVIPSPPKKLNENQLLTIAGSPENIFIAKQGFHDLDRQLSEKLSKQICGSQSCETYQLYKGNQINYDKEEE